MFEQALAAYIQALNLTTYAIRVGYVEPSVSNVVLIQVPPEGLTNSPEIPNYITGNVQVVIRGGNPSADSLLAAMMVDSLRIRGVPVPMSPYTVINMYPTTEPIMYPVTPAGVFEHSITLKVSAIR